MITVESLGLARGKKANKGWVYVLQPSDVEVYKIGHTINPSGRLKAYRKKYPTIPVRYVVKIRTNDCETLEAYFHRQYAHFRLIGEWFLLPQKVLNNFIRLQNMDKL